MDQKPMGPVYLKGHASLKGRILFTNADPGTPDAAFIEQNDAPAEAINALAQQGYLIRTRADSDTKEARENDKSSFVAACASGAQIITTDYYYKSAFFPSDYSISFDGGTYMRRMP